jgi:hypothetical protein
MKQNINLHKLEKDTLTAIFQTGLVEIEIGLIFTVSSLAMIFDNISYIISIFYFVPAVFIFIALRSIAYPRMGIVKFTKKRVRKRLAALITITIALVLIISLRFLGLSDTASGLFSPRLVISSIIFVICLSIAYSLDYTRMYIYAFLLVGTFNLSEEIREHSWRISENGYAYLLAAIILLTTGIIYLVRFLKTHPLPEEEDLKYE